MKRVIAILMLAGFLTMPGFASAAGDEYDDTQSHPLRIVAYFAHPIGFAAKWLVAWPIHYVVSQPGLDKVFGHYPHGDYAFDEEYLQ